MAKEVVGWGVMQGDEKCADSPDCQNEATCYVSYDGCDMIPACKECAKSSTRDRINEVFEQVFPSITVH